jgi:hypothetical protein
MQHPLQQVATTCTHLVRIMPDTFSTYREIQAEWPLKHMIFLSGSNFLGIGTLFFT